jgi:hypothetical protein
LPALWVWLVGPLADIEDRADYNSPVSALIRVENNYACAWLG